jgi:hypothetical protein
MKGLIKHKKIILKIVGFILFFHTALFANPSYSEDTYVKSAYNNKYQQNRPTPPTAVKNTSNDIEVSLNSFGSMSVIIMLILTSLLGAFFVRDEFSGALE